MSRKNDLHAVEKVLIERKRNLEEEFAHLYVENEGEQVQDQADQASSAALETLKSSLQDNEYEEYKMILKALEMIKEGTYGICSECQKAISKKRLASYPNAARCLACQEAQEEKSEAARTDNYV